MSLLRPVSNLVGSPLRGVPGGIFLKHFPAEVLVLITQNLTFDLLFNLVMTMDKLLIHKLTVSGGVESITVNDKTGKDFWPLDPPLWRHIRPSGYPMRCFKKIKSLESFSGLTSFTYISSVLDLRPPGQLLPPIETIQRLPTSLTQLDLEMTGAIEVFSRLIGPTSTALPNLKRLGLACFEPGVDKPFSLIGRLPSTLTDLDICNFNFTAGAPLLSHLPPHLTRFRSRPRTLISFSPSRSANTFLLGDGLLSIQFPPSITQLHIEDAQLEAQPHAKHHWFLALPRVATLSLALISYDALLALPSTLTHLTINRISAFKESDRDYSALKNLTYLSTPLPAPSDRDPPPPGYALAFPNIPSLTTLFVPTDAEKQLDDFIQWPQRLTNLTRIILPGTSVFESQLLHLPPQIGSLVLSDVKMQGISLPDHIETLDTPEIAARHFLVSKRPFQLELWSPNPLGTSGHLQHVPKALNTLSIMHAVPSSALPPTLTKLCYLSMRKGILKELPRTLTYLSALVVSDPIRNGQFIDSCDLMDLPPNLTTLKYVHIRMLDECLPTSPNDGYLDLNLPDDAEATLLARYPMCDLESCTLDPKWLLHSLSSLKVRNLTMEGGVYVVQPNFLFEPGLEYLDIQRASFAHMISFKTFREAPTLHPPLPDSIRIFKASGKDADHYLTYQEPRLLPTGLTHLTLTLSTNGWRNTAVSHLGYLTQLQRLELIASPGCVPAQLTQSTNLPVQLRYKDHPNSRSYFVASSEPIQITKPHDLGPDRKSVV